MYKTRQRHHVYNFWWNDPNCQAWCIPHCISHPLHFIWQLPSTWLPSRLSTSEVWFTCKQKNIHLSHPQGKHSKNKVNHDEISSISACLPIPGRWMQSSSLFYLCKSIASMVSKSSSTNLALVTPKLILFHQVLSTHDMWGAYHEYLTTHLSHFKKLTSHLNVIWSIFSKSHIFTFKNDLPSLFTLVTLNMVSPTYVQNYRARGLRGELTELW